MDVLVFFKKAKTICKYYPKEGCPHCPLNEFCSDGIFALNNEEAKKLVEIVNTYECKM